MTKELFNQIDAMFKAEVCTKNSWGKNEIVALWDKCVLEVLKANL